MRARFSRGYGQKDPTRPPNLTYSAPKMVWTMGYTSESIMKVVFFRSGWMNYYAGTQSGDIRPIGGGSYNETNYGLEISNFKSKRGQLYGYVRTNWNAIGLNLSRIDPSVSGCSEVNDVLVVFIATHPVKGGQWVVGWYTDATVYARSRMIDDRSVVAIARTDRAVLLPPAIRRWNVPTDRGGMRQTTVRYPYNRNGQFDAPHWLRNIVSRINTYHGPNLL